MWNPFLTADERSAIRRGAELYRRREPFAYWFARGFIIVCAVACGVILLWLFLEGEYAAAVRLLLFWSVVYIATCWLTARSIRRIR